VSGRCPQQSGVLYCCLDFDVVYLHPTSYTLLYATRCYSSKQAIYQGLFHMIQKGIDPLPSPLIPSTYFFNASRKALGGC
jgi:hypothetical protein